MRQRNTKPTIADLQRECFCRADNMVGVYVLMRDILQEHVQLRRRERKYNISKTSAMRRLRRIDNKIEQAVKNQLAGDDSNEVPSAGRSIAARVLCR